ncbi:MAG TPA: hypothetical protein VIP11_11200 [Gemmatimonadaceae bacterium]
MPVTIHTPGDSAEVAWRKRKGWKARRAAPDELPGARATARRVVVQDSGMIVHIASG